MRPFTFSDNYICALDIGSSKIAAAVAEVKRGRIKNIFLEEAVSKGVKNGAIVNSIDLIGAISQLLKALKHKSGVNIKMLHVGLCGKDITTKHSNAIMPLSERGNKVVTLSDIRLINEQARILGSSLEEEIIHQIPFGYSIDSRTKILNPLGLYSHRLEVDMYLVCGKLSFIQSLQRVINQAGYEIKDIFFSGIAISSALLHGETKEGLTLVCDIGSDITELSLFRHGMLNNTVVLSQGGEDLTLELCEALNIPFALAEEVKRSYGIIGDYNDFSEDKEVLIKKNNVYKKIKQKQVSQILTTRAKAVCQAIKEAAQEIVALEELDNFIVIGRSMITEGFLELLEGNLGICVKMGRINQPEIASFINKSGMASANKYLTYFTALGIVALGLLEKQKAQAGGFFTASAQRNPALRALNRIKEIYQEYF
ncbi:MAG: cell division protein FtsA [Candidatus Omnitrophica bacterium]|nr:cell division protein FtsA [Candidatus Omnitrophota bacterium]